MKTIYYIFKIFIKYFTDFNLDETNSKFSNNDVISELVSNIKQNSEKNDILYSINENYENATNDIEDTQKETINYKKILLIAGLSFIAGFGFCYFGSGGSIFTQCYEMYDYNKHWPILVNMYADFVRELAKEGDTVRANRIGRQFFSFFICTDSFEKILGHKFTLNEIIELLKYFLENCGK